MMKRHALVTAALTLPILLSGCTPEHGSPDLTSDPAATDQTFGASEDSDSPVTVLAFRPVLATLNSLEPIRANQPRPKWVDQATWKRFMDFDCTSDADQPPNGEGNPQEPDFVCSAEKKERYILDQPALDASDIREARVERKGDKGEWVINLAMNRDGSTAFKELTSDLAHYKSGDPRKRYVVMADNSVLAVQIPKVTVTDGRTQIRGTFTEASAQAITNGINAVAR